MDIKITNQLNNNSPVHIRNIISQTGVFSESEVQVARELAEEHLSNTDSSYLFQLAYHNEELLGYTCYGEIPMTDKRYDLYWIAVSPKAQGSGLAQQLIETTHKHIRSLNGTHVYAETSSTSNYNSARKFYIKQKYIEVARIPSFYKEGDDKVIYAYYL